MNKVKILHCADIHLGSEISSMGHLGIRRRAEIKQSFLNLLHICTKQQVQYLLIAGDLYEHAVPEKELVQEVAEGFAQLEHTKVIIAPGNHDYLSEDSHYIKKGNYPENVYICKETWSSMDFPEDGVSIWGAGFTSMYQTIPLLKEMNPADFKDRIQIGILHGDIVSNAKQSSYNPVTRQQIQKSGLDYLALGHIHMRTGIQKEGNTYYSYCGCHEGRGFDELGDKGIYMGEVFRGGCELQFISSCRRKYIQLEADITGAKNDASAAEMVYRAIYQKAGTAGVEENLYKVVLKGALDDGVIIHIEELKARLQDFYYIKFREELEIKADYEQLSKDKTLKGMFVKRMLGEIEMLEKQGKKREVLAYRQGLQIGLKAFNGEVKYREDK